MGTVFDWQQQPDPVFTKVDPLAQIATAGHGEIWLGQTAEMPVPHLSLAEQVAERMNTINQLELQMNQTMCSPIRIPKMSKVFIANVASEASEITEATKKLSPFISFLSSKTPLCCVYFIRCLSTRFLLTIDRWVDNIIEQEEKFESTAHT